LESDCGSLFLDQSMSWSISAWLVASCCSAVSGGGGGAEKGAGGGSGAGSTGVCAGAGALATTGAGGGAAKCFNNTAPTATPTAKSKIPKTTFGLMFSEISITKNPGRAMPFRGWVFGTKMRPTKPDYYSENDACPLETTP